jgi:hypothetical protein
VQMGDGAVEQGPKVVSWYLPASLKVRVQSSGNNVRARITSRAVGLAQRE